MTIQSNPVLVTEATTQSVKLTGDGRLAERLDHIVSRFCTEYCTVYFQKRAKKCMETYFYFDNEPVEIVQLLVFGNTHLLNG